MPTLDDVTAQVQRMKAMLPFRQWFGAIIAGEVITCDSLRKLKAIARKAGVTELEIVHTPYLGKK